MRSIRYIKEIEEIDHIVANDIDRDAVELIKKNALFNDIPPSKISVLNDNARYMLYSLASSLKSKPTEPEDHITVIDIDPYGSAHSYLDGAIDAITDGGLLAITCTDLAVLCGNYPDSCVSKYGSLPLRRVDYHHEMAIRILLGTISRTAFAQKKKITPVISFYSDFYVRVFVRVNKTRGESHTVPNDVGHVFQCTQCNSFQTNPLSKSVNRFEPTTLTDIHSNCDECGSPVKMGGPLWLSPICDPVYITKALEMLSQPESKTQFGTRDRMLGIFQNLSEELHDVPLFYSLPSLCNTTKLITPKMNVVTSALESLGYRVSRSHTEPNAIKTDAPNKVVWDILRGWNKVSPARISTISPNSPAYKILTKETEVAVSDFILNNETPQVIDKLSGKSIKRFIKIKNGGPSSRAKRRYVT